MALKKMALRPGINTQLSPTLNDGGWSDGNLVRFPYGVPQPFGGWTQFLTATLQGICRALLAWSQLDTTTNLAAATHQKLQLIQAGTIFDLTPVRASLALPSGAIVIAPGSAIATVTSAGHGCAVGDFLEVPSGTDVGGIALDGEQVVTSVTANTLTFTAAAVSSTGGSNAASVTVNALITTGISDSLLGAGYGSGGFGTGPYGQAVSGQAALTVATQWSLDHWGEDLVACRRGGPIYIWIAANGTANRAAVISANAPTIVNIVLVGMPERHLIAFGCNQGTAFDPMLVAWSDVEDYTTWVATANNSAGTYRLAAGNSIIGVLPVSGEILVFTESSVYAMTFVGAPYYYSFTALEGDHTGLIAQKAAVTAGNGLVFWMGQNSFFTYNGSAMPLKCDVWDRVFSNLNRQQAAKILAGSNAAFGEVMWFYPSAGSTEIDSLVVFNYLNLTWTIGALPRTAWLDLTIFSTPLATDPTGIVYQHEDGTDANGVPLPAWVSTGFTDLSDGDEIPFLSQVVPDFSDQQGTVQITVDSKVYPDDAAAKTKGPFSLTAASRFISPRLRGRQISMMIGSSGTGAFWRLGALRVRLGGSGRR